MQVQVCFVNCFAEQKQKSLIYSIWEWEQDSQKNDIMFIGSYLAEWYQFQVLKLL